MKNKTRPTAGALPDPAPAPPADDAAPPPIGAGLEGSTGATGARDADASWEACSLEAARVDTAPSNGAWGAATAEAGTVREPVATFALWSRSEPGRWAPVACAAPLSGETVTVGRGTVPATTGAAGAPAGDGAAAGAIGAGAADARARSGLGTEPVDEGVLGDAATGGVEATEGVVSTPALTAWPWSPALAETVTFAAPPVSAPARTEI